MIYRNDTWVILGSNWVSSYTYLTQLIIGRVWLILPPLIMSAALLVNSECGCVGLAILDLCGAMQFFSCEVRHWFGLVWVREKSLWVCYVAILVNNFFFLYFSATPNLCICERKLFGCIGVLDYVKLPLLYLALSKCLVMYSLHWHLWMWTKCQTT